MAREPAQSDVDLAQALLTAKRPEDQIIATLVYRGLERPAAESVLNECLGHKPNQHRQQPTVAPDSGPAFTMSNAGPALATLGFVLGALSLLGLAFPIFLLLGVPAVICAHVGSHKIRKWDDHRSGLMAARAGCVCGYVSVIVLLLATGVGFQLSREARKIARAHECQQNLRDIHGAKMMWGLEKKKSDTDTPTPEDLREYLKQGFPRCPGGGVYTVNSLSQEPTCSLAGHAEYVQIPAPKLPRERP